MRSKDLHFVFKNIRQDGPETCIDPSKIHKLSRVRTDFRSLSSLLTEHFRPSVCKGMRSNQL